jgi:hypothetical protein
MPYQDKFKNIDTAVNYLEKLNHSLTTLSELEIDRPKTGYTNRFCQNQKNYVLPYMPYGFGSITGQLDQFVNRQAEELSANDYGEQRRTLTKHYDNKVVKVVKDTLKNGQYGAYLQRTVELLSDGDTIMGNVQKYIQQNIIGMEINAESCYSITETLKGAICLDLSESERIINEVRKIYKDYCREIAGNIAAVKNGSISENDFKNALENIINVSDEKLREISADRTALAFAAYMLSLENGQTSQSFPFLTVLDGMVALLNDVKTVDYYDIKIRNIIPERATHLIVYQRRCRLPENICPDKTYFGDVNLSNGSYELHRDLKGNVSLIVPKPVPKHKLNVIPFNGLTDFSLKISYKASELLPENQNGEYVTHLMADRVVTFRESTMKGNIQYCVYADDVWVGTIFDDQNNKWVVQKEAVRTLKDNEYKFVGIPHTGVKTNSNSFITGSGIPRTAQVLTFVQAA